MPAQRPEADLTRRPGPLLFEQHADFAWALIASMYIGNVMLLILNLPLIRIFVKLIDIRPTILFPLVLVFSIIGVYGVNRSTIDVLLLAFGVLGYFMRRYAIPPAPVILAMVLGPGMEVNFRRAMSLSNGDASIFFTGVLINVLWVLALLSLFSPQIQAYIQRKRGWKLVTDDQAE